jgi:hypothetical protein
MFVCTGGRRACDGEPTARVTGCPGLDRVPVLPTPADSTVGCPWLRARELKRLMMRAMDHHIARLGHLVAELSDAHLDTIEIASGHCRGPCTELDWESHIEYLQRLRRLAEESLAHTTVSFAMAAIPSVPDLAPSQSGRPQSLRLEPASPCLSPSNPPPGLDFDPDLWDPSARTD